MKPLHLQLDLQYRMGHINGLLGKNDKYGSYGTECLTRSFIRLNTVRQLELVDDIRHSILQNICDIHNYRDRHARHAI